MSFWRKKFVLLDAGFAHYLNRLNYLGILKKDILKKILLFKLLQCWIYYTASFVIGLFFSSFVILVSDI